MKILHIVPGMGDVANGMAVVARLLAKEQGDSEVVDLKSGLHCNIVSDMTGRSGVSPLQGKGAFDFFKKRRDAASPSQCDEPVEGKCEGVEEVWVHGMWLPKEWLACWRALRAGKRLVRMPHGSLSPLYLRHQSPFKKWLVGPIERWCLRRCDRIVATCEAEKGWIERYLGKKCPAVEVTDVKRFFDLGSEFGSDGKIEAWRRGFQPRQMGAQGATSEATLTWREAASPNDSRAIHLLYLGRRHPLKGVEYLEKAVAELNSNSVNSVNSVQKTSTCSTRLKPELRIISSVFGEELENVWQWCDVLVLPTLSDNFGLVVAEALERGKRVITTDGAPAWGDGNTYGGRLCYLRGFRKATPAVRVAMLKDAILSLITNN